MSATLPLPEPEDTPLSPWWKRTILAVMVFGFAILKMAEVSPRSAV